MAVWRWRTLQSSTSAEVAARCALYLSLEEVRVNNQPVLLHSDVDGVEIFGFFRAIKSRLDISFSLHQGESPFDTLRPRNTMTL